MSIPQEIKTSRGGKQLVLDGHVYYRWLSRGAKDYWYCPQTERCQATCHTTLSGNTIIVKKVGPHNHPPDREAAKAEIVKATIKQKATQHPEATPAWILRAELPKVGSSVLAHLPDRYFLILL